MTEIKVGQLWRHKRTGKVAFLELVNGCRMHLSARKANGDDHRWQCKVDTLLRDYEPADAPHTPRPAVADWRPYPQERPQQLGRYLVWLSGGFPSFAMRTADTDCWQDVSHWALGPKPPRGAR